MPRNDDEKIWAAYAKGVKPIKRPPSPGISRPIPSAAKKAKPAVPPRKAESKPVPVAQDFFAPLERSFERKLREGKIEPEAEIDLHGKWQREAHAALIDFIGRHAKNGHRHLLVITGKGRDGEGVIRASIVEWLKASQFATRILALRQAAPKHGGTGAYYVVLKRQRPEP